MRIDRNLNLVMQIQTANSGTVFIHSVSVGREIFEKFYLQIGKVFSQCFDGVSSAHLALSAPQLAYPALKSISIADGNWEGRDGVNFGLINEIKRLTNVLVSGENGWQMLPFDVAVKQNILDEDEESEAISSLVFFTAISKVAPKELKNSFLEMAGSLRGWELTSSDCTAYLTGLTTSTKEEPITKKKKASSVIA